MCGSGGNPPPSSTAPTSGPSSASPPSVTVACQPEPEYHLHVDADRDGTVDDDRTGIDTWEWGRGKKGAIILCNNDDEDSTKRCDNEDNKINSAPDPDDIAPLVIRRVTSKPVAPATWHGFLEVAATDAQHIRIFESRAAGAPEIIGPTAGHQYTFPDLNFTEKEFGMEAVRYPNSSFSGEITITFRIEIAGASAQTENAVVRAAPWVIFTHFDQTKKVYVADAGDNATFRGKLNTEVSAAGVPAPTQTTNSDRWMQDAMEIGFSTLPKTKPKPEWSLPVVLRTANDRSSMGWGDIDKYPKDQMLSPGYGFTQALPPTRGSSLDSFGNLECSPPFTNRATGKEYKFGRIVYGMDAIRPLRDMRLEVREFLFAQKVQEPFPIHTGWLIVGHVDEAISFCPMKNAPKKFKVLIASPARAVTILTDLQSAGHGTARLFQGIDFGASFGGTFNAASLAADFPLRTVNAILGNAAFMAVQVTVQGHIDSIQAQLKSELGLEDSDFISLPVLFKEQGGRHVAYTPGVVNMLVLTKADKTIRACIPKPFGPVVGGQCKFEEDVRTKLGPAAATGVDLEFVDDFRTYHVGFGEIHCGTNSQREPPTDRFWWEQEV